MRPLLLGLLLLGLLQGILLGLLVLGLELLGLLLLGLLLLRIEGSQGRRREGWHERKGGGAGMRAGTR